MMKTVSVVIPCRNEERTIRQCVETLAHSYGAGTDYNLELLVIDGLSSDNTREIVTQAQCDGLPVRIIDNKLKITPVALNLGIQNATGEYVMIASAHSAFDQNYISILLDELSRLDADGVGGFMQTIVQHPSPKTLAIIEVMSCKFGVGNATFRTGASKVTQVDTVPFGLYKRETLLEVGGYDERLVRNHDIELSKRLLAAGKRIYLIPHAICSYFVRETYSAIAQNNFRNGLWNILTVKITKDFSSLSLRHFVPLLFLLSLIVPLALAPLWWPLLLVPALSLACYLLAMGIISAKIATSKRLNFFYLCWTFMVLHFSYASGSLVGIFKPVQK